MTNQEMQDDCYNYIKGRIDELATGEHTEKYLQLLIPLVNILWEQESGLASNAQYNKQWKHKNLTIKIEHGK